MTIWDDHKLEEHIRDILAEQKPGNSLGRPFLTAYQLAIELNEAHPEIAEDLGYKIGGRNTGSRNSLSQYLARELAGRISSGEIDDIEGAALSHIHTKDHIFSASTAIIESSTNEAGFPLSMFRLKDPKNKLTARSKTD